MYQQKNLPPYMQAPRDTTHSIMQEEQTPQTFIFSHLPPEEKKRFMDFLIENQVEFRKDSTDGSYIATVKVVNHQSTGGPTPAEPQVINGMDQIKQMKSQKNTNKNHTANMLQGQINDLHRNNNRGMSPDLADVVGTRDDLSPIPGNNGNNGNQAASSALGSARRRPNTTSAAQLQVYLLPDYQQLVQSLRPRNPEQIRPKRMNLQQTLRLIDEIYTFRFQQKTKQNQQPLFQAVIDCINQKYNKLKQKVDQATFDLLASLEQHRETSTDVDLFTNFLIGIQVGFQVKELLFYLYVRSLAEQSLSVVFARLPSSQDVRNVFLNKQKSLKIARVYFSNALSAQSHVNINDADAMQGHSDQLAESFVDRVCSDASQTGLFDQKYGLQVSYFLQSLLGEFQTQETYQFATPQPQNKSGNPGQQANNNNNHAGGRDAGNRSELGPDKTIELLSQIISYVVHHTLSDEIGDSIAHQGQQCHPPLNQDQEHQLRQEANKEMEQLVAQLLQAAFQADLDTWLSCLNIQNADQHHQEQFEQVHEAMNEIFDQATYDFNQEQSPVQIDDNSLEHLASQLVQIEDLLLSLDNVVAELIAGNSNVVGKSRSNSNGRR